MEKNYKENQSMGFLGRIVIKSLIFFSLCNVIFSLVNPTDYLGHFSAYNIIFPGRKRLPYGERPDLAYNLSTYNLPAMFSTHEINKLYKPDNEFRIIVIGDSSVWGYLLPLESTLSEQINQMQVDVSNGRIIRAFNLGYPTLSATKDLLFLSQAVKYQPDLVIWLVTLESLVWEKQFSSPIVLANSRRVNSILQSHRVEYDLEAIPYPIPSFWEKTIIGQRRNLADIFRLQVYGVLWAATGIDQAYPESYEPPQYDLAADETYYSLFNPISASDLALSILETGISVVGEQKIMLVNEPIFVSSGKNSDLRYNFFYPRWVYDEYRHIMLERNWFYLDAWDSVPPSEFTNSAIHLSPIGTNLLAQKIVAEILNEFRDPQKP